MVISYICVTHFCLRVQRKGVLDKAFKGVQLESASHLGQEDGGAGDDWRGLGQRCGAAKKEDKV